MFRLIFANWLSQVDKPAAEPAPFARHAGVLIYDIDQASPPTARAVTPEELGHAIDESLLAKLVLSQDGTDPANTATRHGRAMAVGPERRRRSAPWSSSRPSSFAASAASHRSRPASCWEATSKSCPRG